jgi:hypothetical protein
MRQVTGFEEVAKRAARLILLAGLAACGYVEGTAAVGATSFALAQDTGKIMAQPAASGSGAPALQRPAVGQPRTAQPAFSNATAPRAGLPLDSTFRYRLQTATLADAVRDFDHSGSVPHSGPPPSTRSSIRSDVISAMNSYGVNSTHPRLDTHVALHDPDPARQGASANLRDQASRTSVMKISSIR